MGALIEYQECYKRFALLWNLVANQRASNPTCTCNFLGHCPFKGCISTGRSICDHSLHLLLQTIPDKKAFQIFYPKITLILNNFPSPCFSVVVLTDIIRLKWVFPFFWFLWWGVGLLPTVPGLPGPPRSPTGPAQEGFLAKVLQATVHS